MLTMPSVAGFKKQFARDFSYGPGNDKVTDLDIQAGLNAAYSVFNIALFDTNPIGVAPLITSEAQIAYCNAAAHFLVTSIQAVGGLGKVGRGVFSQGEGVVTGKSAGGLNISLSFPAAITDSPALFQFAKTTYGLAYLQVLALKLVGNIAVVAGETTCGPVANPGFF